MFNSTPAAERRRTDPQVAPYFLDWLDHPTYDSYWKQWSIEENFQNIQVPALTIAAWYDLFQGGSLRNYLGIKQHGGSEAARNGQKLLIIVGGHAGSGRTIGTVDFGDAAAEYIENDTTLDWYDYLFLGKQNQFASADPVRIFVMGENKWRDEAGVAARTGKGDAVLSALGRDGQRQRWRRQLFRRSLLRRRQRTSLCTIRPTLCRRWAVRCVATEFTCPPGRATRRMWRPGQMCWSTPRRLWRRTLK